MNHQQTLTAILSDDARVPMKKQPEITAATRQRIIDSFWNLYAENPVSCIRIKEIAAASGMNRCTFYQYFADIYDILHQEEERIISEIVKKRTIIGSSSDFASMLPEIAEMYQNNGRLLCILTGPNGDPGFPILLRNSLLSIFKVQENVPDAAESSIIFDFGLNGLLAAFRTWYLSEGEVTVEKFLYLAEELISHGIPSAILHRN